MMSAFHPKATEQRTQLYVGFVPTTDIGAIALQRGENVARHTAATCNIDDAILPSQSPFAFSRKITMKIARQVVLGAAIALAAFGQASAQDWPTRSVTVVVPIPAGVASDIIARVVFEQVGKQVGQTFVIENRPGAGGTIGANMVAKAAPDGHSILVYGSIAAANALYARLPYDTVADFTPVVPFGETPLVVVTAVGRYNTLAELIAAAKAKPGELNYSTVGIGSAAHFGAVRLAVSAGITAQHIPFKGPEWLADTIAGRVTSAFLR